MYTRVQFGKELKNKVAQKMNVSKIGSWAFEIYIGDADENDREFLNLLIALATMEEGAEFELSYKRLNEIANDLINEKKEINLDY